MHIFHKGPDMTLPKKKTVLVSLATFAIAYFALSQYFTWFRSTSGSYSYTQKWNEYHSVEDWDMSRHAVTDIDGDGQKDMITLMDSCAYLSSIPAEQIPDDRECKQPGMTRFVFGDREIVGQRLKTAHPYRYNWLMKSYLVRTIQQKWRFVEINGLQVRVFELQTNGIFQEVAPTFADRVDTVTYQVTHLGVVATILVMTWISQTLY